jgi:hypothetical protein
MAVLAGEKSKLQLETATPGTYADVVQVVAVTRPGLTVPEVKKTNLASTVQEYRAGRIPDNGTCEFRVQFDPNDTTHQALYTTAAAGTAKNWKYIFADGMTTPANVMFAAFITEISPSETSAEDDSNVEATVTMRVTGAVTRTAGV